MAWQTKGSSFAYQRAQKQGQVPVLTEAGVACNVSCAQVLGQTGLTVDENLLDEQGMTQHGVSVSSGVISVSKALQFAQNSLECLHLRIEGEVSECTDKPGYKAVYFSISDKDAVLPCVMWRSVYEASKLFLKPGMLVELKGNFSLYKAKGRMQFMVRELKLAGEGDLRQKVAARAELLRREGLMREDKKVRPSAFCERIALITSPRGKAVHDVLRTLKRRNSMVRIFFYGVAVEGEKAAVQMAKALSEADACGYDAILLVRGGGSYEDLMPFNDEMLARSLAACITPVVTGIGHEPDNSICDMVADVRCSTPTAAAEFIAPSASELTEDLQVRTLRLKEGLQNKLAAQRLRFDAYCKRPIFTQPGLLFKEHEHELALSEDALHRVLPAQITLMSASYKQAHLRLSSFSKYFLRQYHAQFTTQAAQLDSLSPLSVLTRGYSMVQDDEGKTVSSVEELKHGQDLYVAFKDGKAQVEVKELFKDGVED